MSDAGTIGTVTATFTGQAGELANAARQVRSELEQTGQSTERLSTQMEKYGSAAERAAQAQQRSAQMTERAMLRAAQAQGAMNASMEATVPRAMAASAAIRVLEGNVTNNIRAAEKFISTLPGVGAALQMAFPLVGAVAFLGVITEMGGRFAEFIQKNLMAGSLITEAMEKIQQSTRASAHELELENAKLDEQIAKLEGRPFNGLALALAQARVEADRLTKSLDDAYDAQQKALKEHAISFFGGALTGQGSTGPAADMAKANAEAIHKINAKYNDLLDLSSGEDQAKIEAERRDELRKEIQRQRDAYAAKWNALNQQQQASASAGLDQMGPASLAMMGAGAQRPLDQTANMGAYGMGAHQAEEQLRLLDDAAANAQKQKRADADQGIKASHDELMKYLEVFHRLQAEGYKLEEEQKKLLDESAKIQREIIQDSYTALEPNPQAMKAQTELIMSRMEAMKANFAAVKEAARAQQEFGIRVSEATGSMTRQQAAVARDQIAVGALQDQYSKLADDKDKADKNPALWTKDFNPDVIGNQMTIVGGQLGIAAQQQNLDQYLDSFGGKMDVMFADWIQKATDLSAAMSRMWQESINGVNNVLTKMVTGDYKKGDWDKMAKQLAGSASRSALENAEGIGLKALGLGSGGKLGTAGNPIHAIIDGGLPGMPGGAGGGSGVAGAAGKGLLGWLNNSNWAGNLAGGKLFGAGGIFAGALAGGGDFSPGYYMVGEEGPEIAHFGSGGHMHTASETREILHGPGSGGDIHFNVDARGTDPSLTRANFERALTQIHAQSVKDATRAMREQEMRKPRR